MSKLKELGAAGQSVWLDFIRRDMVANGELAALVDEGVTGVTSNPSIFQAAIAGSDLYDEDIAAAGGDPLAVFEALAIADVQGATDVLRGVYDATDGFDGYVSLEVSPALADDAVNGEHAPHRVGRCTGRQCRSGDPPDVAIELEIDVEHLAVELSIPTVPRQVIPWLRETQDLDSEH